MWRASALFLTIVISYHSLAADFIPRDIKSIQRRRATHWLDRELDRRVEQKIMNSGCATALTPQEGKWVSESYFYLPEIQIEMGLRLAEGGAVWNKNPDEYQFSFPPSVFEALGGRLFKAYSKPVTYLALNGEEEQVTYSGWKRLFGIPGLQKGYSGIQILKISADGLFALAHTKAFSNAHTLIVEPKEIEHLITILQSGNLPKLRRLHLIASQLGAEDLKKLLSHPSISPITELSLAMMNFKDQGMQYLAEAPHTSRLTAISLEVPSLQACPERPTQIGFELLLRSPNLVHLEKLAIRSIWEWGDEALQTLAAWPGLESLTYLELQNSQSDMAIPKFLGKIKFRQLEELRLEHTTFDDKLLDALASNGELVSLRRVVVDLHEDVSRDAVMGARTVPHLREAVISYDIKQ